jgi:hypothetical protein
MIHHARVVPLIVRRPSTGVPPMNWPTQTAARRPATPAAVTQCSLARPYPPDRSAIPIATAIGIVAAIVKTPHGDSARAFTTTSARTARTMTLIAVTLTRATSPAKGPTSSRTILPSDRPPRRTEQKRMTLSWTAPPNTAPTRIHSRPGR